MVTFCLQLIFDDYHYHCILVCITWNDGMLSYTSSIVHSISILKKLNSVGFLFLFLRFRAAPVAYGSYQARGRRIRAVAASLCHSHSNTGSQLRLHPTPQLMAMLILNSLSEAKDWTCILIDPSWVRWLLSHYGNSLCWIIKLNFLLAKFCAYFKLFP